jgi:fatty-acyl-CoA synthase
VTSTFPIAADESWERHEHQVLRVIGRLARTPDREVLHWRGSWITAAGLGGLIRDAIAAGHAAGVGPGSTVGILTEPNHPAMLTVRYAAHFLGAAVVQLRSINPRADSEMLPVREQVEIVRSADIGFLFVDAEHAPRAQEISRSIPGRLKILGVRDPGPDSGSETGETPAPAPYAPERRAVVTFTSGSTGRPKPLLQSFRAWNRTVGVFPGRMVESEPATVLAVTPVSHTVGSMIDASLAEGGRVILHERFETAAVLRAFTEHRVTDVYLAVPHLHLLVTHPDLPDTDLTGLRRVIYSGTPAAPRRIAEAVRVLGGSLIQLYGSTEAGGITSLTPSDHLEPELLPTVGRPFPWVELRVLEPGTGREVPRGGTGEVCVKSPTVMTGYLADPALNEQVFGGGWLRTGDLGHWDRYGYLRLTGRVGHVIKSGGLKIHPGAVERALLSHDDVVQAAVYGVADADRVESVHAAVVLRTGAAATPEALRDHVAGQLGPVHAPARIALWDELPLTTHGKPDKALLTALARREV